MCRVRGGVSEHDKTRLQGWVGGPVKCQVQRWVAGTVKSVCRGRRDNPSNVGVRSIPWVITNLVFSGNLLNF